MNRSSVKWAPINHINIDYGIYLFFDTASCNNRPPPNDIRDGIVRYHGVKHNDKARYKCHSGFRLEGDTYLICQKGVWVGRKPICVPGQ